MAKVTVQEQIGNDTEREMVHQFDPSRGIVDMGGVYTLVDRRDDGKWELSGVPAREHEKPVLQRFVDSVENQTTVTAPDGTVTTFTHEGGQNKR